VWGLCLVTLLEPRILRWFLDLWKIYVPLYGTKLNSKLVSKKCTASGSAGVEFSITAYPNHFAVELDALVSSGTVLTVSSV
jgi:hypothetical protein